MLAKQPSLWKILTIDYWSCLTVLGPILFWIVLGSLILFGKGNQNPLVLLIVCTAVTIIALIFLVWRINQFFKVYGDGLEANATISDITMFGGRGNVFYLYEYQGKKYSTNNTVNYDKRTKILRVGQRVIVLVDRDSPQCAFIRDLYLGRK